jgi:hypothetical protein
MAVGVQSSGVRRPFGSAPYIAMNTAIPAIAITLLSTGAQVKGPNTLFALSTSPSIV